MEYLKTKCPICGDEKEIEVKEDQLVDYVSGGKLIQDAFPDMNKEDRERLLTGVCPKCWKELMTDGE